jgi:transcriptional regulator with XRE-family HTH domain
MDGKPIRRVLEWLLDRDLTDADMAAALDVHPSHYSRHKGDDDYPSFEELNTLGGYFHVSPRMLQIAFGLLDTDVLILLTEDEMKQYLEQGGGNHMEPTGAGRTESRNNPRLSPRADRPPL